MNRLAMVTVVAVLATACSSDKVATPAPTDGDPGVATAPPSSTVAPPTTQPITDAPTTAPPEPLRIVGLGDSLPGGLLCELPCESFVKVYGRLAGEALGRPVEVVNLATNDSLESPLLLERVKGDQRHRDALAAADIVTVHIGLNDLSGAVIPCGGLGDRTCWDATESMVMSNLAAVLGEITALRGGQPTAIRVTTWFNMYPGMADVVDNAPWQTFWTSEFMRFAAMTCDVATAHAAMCIDLIPLFNGPSGDGDPGVYVQPNPDHVHLNKAGHDLVAQEIAKAGFAPVG